jgi:uncharacterized protein YycO
LIITLQFSRDEGWGSRIIRWFTWSDYSHVDFVLWDGTLLGARTDGGVQVRKRDYKKFAAVKKYQVEAPGDVIAFALSQVGKPYDRTGIVNFGLHRDWRAKDSWFCSELVAAAFESAGRPLLQGDYRRITPRDLMLSPFLQEVK